MRKFLTVLVGCVFWSFVLSGALDISAYLYHVEDSTRRWVSVIVSATFGLWYWRKEYFDLLDAARRDVAANERMNKQ